MYEGRITWTHRAWARALWVLSVIIACVSQTAAATDDEAWDFSLMPYYWWMGVDADLSVAGQDVELRSKDFSDPDQGAMGGYFEAFRERWGMAWSGQHLIAEAEPARDDLKEVQSQHTRLDFMLAYRRTWHGPGKMRLDLVPMGGVRYRNMRQELVTTETNLVKTTRNGFEPVVGARAEWWLSGRLSLGLMAEASGFDVSSAPRIQWGVTTTARYQMGKEFALLAGYRWEHLDYHRDTPAGAFAFDGGYDGAWVGLSMDFKGTPAPDLIDADSAKGLLDDPVRYLTSGLMGEIPAEAPADEYRFRRWLDRVHGRFNHNLDRWVDDIDTVLAEGDKPLRQREKSKFYVSLDLQLKEYEEQVELDIRPSLNVKLDIPNLEHDAAILLTHQAIDEMPGADPFERERGLSLGIESAGWLIKKARLRLSVRTSSKSGVDLETRYYWEPTWRHGAWEVKPHLGAYYSGDKGFGTLSFLMIQYRLEDRFQGFYLPSINHNEEMESAEFSHNFALLYQFEGTHEDYHRAVMTRLAIDGTVDENAKIYRWEPLGYRAPLYGKWLYYHIAPQVSWRDENSWEPEFAMRLYIEALFFGTEGR